MATLRKRRNGDGSTSWDATVRIVGYPTVGKSFRTKIQAELWAARTETAAKGGTLACGRGIAAPHLRHHGVDGVARRELQQQEHADQDQEQGRDRGGQTPPREAKDAHKSILADTASGGKPKIVPARRAPARGIGMVARLG